MTASPRNSRRSLWLRGEDCTERDPGWAIMARRVCMPRLRTPPAVDSPDAALVFAARTPQLLREFFAWSGFVP